MDSTASTARARRFAVSFRFALLTHPALLPLPATRPVPTPGGLDPLKPPASQARSSRVGALRAMGLGL
ncbi:hypothetical protein [Nonomuraea jabiensis]|uniref:Uncharacterized protein n=1 Tax=Nonomuraea jabiensis TaxID=882448 RepID=A0A7W9FZG7_9ACTN|nr:hypothetical protein [Nonomuraea jabiensis]MBB5774339.1 hypothetical protein [Nonomuraea jabiensis]